MADRYWVGGTAAWDTTSTAVWSATSGGASGASVPTAADNVIFDSATVYTVTLTGALTCLSFTVSAGTVTFTSTGTLAVSGSFLIIPGTVWSATGLITFNSTTTGNTITTNSVSMAASIALSGVGGAWGLGSAHTSTGNITILDGSFSTNNFSVTITSFIGNTVSTPRVVNLGSSTFTANGFLLNASITLDAGTSSIIFPNPNVNFSGGSKTFNNVSFTSTAGVSRAISGSNTFNNLTFSSSAAVRETLVTFSGDTVVTGTLTLGTSANPAIRAVVRSSIPGTTRTFTVASVAALSEVDFRDIAVSGASAPWSGTRLGDCGGNSGITFDAGVTKYWSLAAGGNWSATAWALTSGGVPSAANFPLPQDTVVIDDLGLILGATITINSSWQIGTLDASGRTLAATLTFTGTASLYGNFTLSTAVTPAGTGVFTVSGRGTQTITPAGRTFTNPWTLQSANGVIAFAGAVTSTSTITMSQGTIRFLAGSTNTATTFAIAGGAATPVFLTSSTPGTQFTLSQATGTVSAVNTTISDSNATGGATWQGLSANNAIDAGNNTGWVFDMPFGSIVFQQPVRLRSFTERGRD